MDAVTLVRHPLVQHKLSLIREKTCSTKQFRELLNEISLFLGYEVTRDLPVVKREIETPMAKMDAPNPSRRWASGDAGVTPSRVCGQAVHPLNASIIAFTSPRG